jgi:hypothetical protein
MAGESGFAGAAFLGRYRDDKHDPTRKYSLIDNALRLTQELFQQGKVAF